MKKLFLAFWFLLFSNAYSAQINPPTFTHHEHICHFTRIILETKDYEIDTICQLTDNIEIIPKFKNSYQIRSMEDEMTIMATAYIIAMKSLHYDDFQYWSYPDLHMYIQKHTGVIDVHKLNQCVTSTKINKQITECIKSKIQIYDLIF